MPTESILYDKDIQRKQRKDCLHFRAGFIGNMIYRVCIGVGAHLGPAEERAARDLEVQAARGLPGGQRHAQQAGSVLTAQVSVRLRAHHVHRHAAACAGWAGE